MKIIILPGSRRKSFSLAIGPLSGVGLLLAALGVFGGSFYGGLYYATLHSEEIADRLRRQVGSAWEQELDQQQQEISAARTEARKSLDAMASRVSILQGNVLRLDALGARLSTMAGVDMEFGAGNPPGMGGPEPTAGQVALGTGDFLTALADLERAVQDKADKLSALESIMLDRSLREQTQPDGSPASDFWLSSVFGFRTDPMTGLREFHSGVDFAGAAGSPITAAAAGIVTWSGPRFGYGNLVEISHGNGYLTRYGHNSRNLVGIGDKVEKGEIIALMGSSGRATGTHVHFEVVRNGEFLNPRGSMKL